LALDQVVGWLFVLFLVWGFIRVATKKGFFHSSNVGSQTAMESFMNQDKRKSMEYVQYQQEVEKDEAEPGGGKDPQDFK
jgi:hypothetical protein